MNAGSLKKRLELRRQRNRELAALDAKNRCAKCKIGLSADAQVFMIWGDEARFCSSDCRDDVQERRG